jgi:hypothetical protein
MAGGTGRGEVSVSTVERKTCRSVAEHAIFRHSARFQRLLRTPCGTRGARGDPQGRPAVGLPVAGRVRRPAGRLRRRSIPSRSVRARRSPRLRTAVAIGAMTPGLGSPLSTFGRRARTAALAGRLERTVGVRVGGCRARCRTDVGSPRSGRGCRPGRASLAWRPYFSAVCGPAGGR